MSLFEFLLELRAALMASLPQCELSDEARQKLVAIGQRCPDFLHACGCKSIDEWLEQLVAGEREVWQHLVDQVYLWPEIEARDVNGAMAFRLATFYTNPPDLVPIPAAI